MPTDTGMRRGISNYRGHPTADPHQHQAPYGSNQSGDPARSGQSPNEYMPRYQASTTSSGHEYLTTQEQADPARSQRTPAEFMSGNRSTTTSSGSSRKNPMSGKQGRQMSNIPTTRPQPRSSPPPLSGIPRQHFSRCLSSDPPDSEVQESLLHPRDARSAARVDLSLDSGETVQTSQSDFRHVSTFRRQKRNFQMPDFIAIAQGRVDISQVKSKPEPVEASTNPMPAANATLRQAKQALISESQIAADAAPVKQKKVSGSPTTKPEQKAPAVATEMTALIQPGVATPRTTVQPETDEGASWKMVSKKTGKTSTTNVGKSELVSSASGPGVGKPTTNKPAWSSVITGRPSKPAKSFATTADDAKAEVNRLFVIVRKIPPGAPGYTQAKAAFEKARDELAKFAEAPGVGKDAFPDLKTPVAKLLMPPNTSMINSMLDALKQPIVVTPIDVDNLRAATAIAQCSPFHSVQMGAWRFVRIRGTLCGKELAKGIFCQEEHPMSWHDLVYSIPLIEHWTNAQTFMGDGYLASFLKGESYCTGNNPHHYADSCGAGMFRMNPYSAWEMQQLDEAEQLDKKYFLYYSSAFNFYAERYPLHPAAYIPKGTTIKVSGFTVCQGFDLPEEYKGFRPKVTSGYGAGLANKRIKNIKDQLSEMDRYARNQNLNATNYRTRVVDKVELNYVVEGIYNAVNRAQVFWKYVSSEEELPQPDLPFWTPIPDCGKKSSTVLGPNPANPNVGSLAKDGQLQHSSAKSPGIVDPSVEAARIHWVRYNADSRLPPSGYFPNTQSWPREDHWAMIDQELNHPDYQDKRQEVDKLYTEYQASSEQLETGVSAFNEHQLKSHMRTLVRKLEAICAPVIRAWPLAKDPPQVQSPATDGGSDEQLFKCSSSGYNASHSKEVGKVSQELRSLAPAKPEEHLKQFSNRLLNVQLTSARIEHYKQWLSKWWSMSINPQAIAGHIRFSEITSEEAESEGLQMDSEEIHKFLESIMNEELKGQTVVQIIDELFVDLLRCAKQFRDQPQVHVTAIEHHKQKLVNIFTDYEKKLTARFNYACAQADKPYVTAEPKHIPNAHANTGSIRKLFFRREFAELRQKLCSYAFPWFYLHEGLPQLVFPDRAVDSFQRPKQVAEASATK